MTDGKKLKRKVRARAEQTGESYAAARRVVVAKVNQAREAQTHATAERARQAPATGTVSEAKCIERTGHGFGHWFSVLDRFGAAKAGHKAAARHLLDDHGISAWYSQTITVAFERAKGLREVNQVCQGSYQTSVSRVLPLEPEEALALFTHATQRARWLGPLTGDVADSLQEALRTGDFKPGKNVLRLRYRPGTTLAEIELRKKEPGRCTAIVRHSKIASQADLESQRDQWRVIFDALRVAARDT